MTFCGNCGKRIPEGVSFCPYCGTNLKEIRDRLEAMGQEKSGATEELPREEPRVFHQQPPYTQQGYRTPFYTQKEELGYLHQKPQTQPAPARGMAILGRLAGIFGMISSIMLMLALLMSLSAYMGDGIRSLLAGFEKNAVLLFCAALEGLILSFLGIFLSHRAAAKGNPSTTAGKRLGIVGLILSAINVVDLVLFMIVLFMG